jgi:Nif-specific regulatory protein
MGMVVAVPVHIGGKVSGMMVAEPSENTPESLEATHGFLAIVAHFISQAITIHEAASQDKQELISENYLLLEETSRGYHAENIIYASGAMQEVVDRAMTVAKSNADALILGETGTGKELIAGLVHYHSARSGKPLVRVNCAALPAGLLESELFGHVKGAFTGAVSARQGRFEMADGGSIFLDEVAEIPLDLQPKLLRVLQEREYDPVGASVTKRVNVRVIAASNRDLDKEIAEGRFRQDLYYRLNVVPIIIPPLRKRTGDIPPLVEFFIARSNRKNFKDVHGVTQKAMDLFMCYSWPGNVRELENAVEHAVVLSDKPEIDIEHLPLALRVFAGAAEGSAPSGASDSGIAEREPSLLGLAARALSTPGQAHQMYLDEAERVLFKKALEMAGGNRTEAARLLGLSRNTLAKRLTELGLTQ